MNPPSVIRAPQIKWATWDREADLTSRLSDLHQGVVYQVGRAEAAVSARNGGVVAHLFSCRESARHHPFLVWCGGFPFFVLLFLDPAHLTRASPGFVGTGLADPVSERDWLANQEPSSFVLNVHWLQWRATAPLSRGDEWGRAARGSSQSRNALCLCRIMRLPTSQRAS